MSFVRRWRVQLGPLVTEQLRCVFKISRTLSKEPNTCDVSVYNLSEPSRRQLVGANTPVIVQAGYEGQTIESATLFSGEARRVDHTREEVDWKTEAFCGDGEREYQFANLNKSFSSSTFQQVITEVAQSLTPNIGNLKEALAEAARTGAVPDLSRGFVASGRSGDTLSTLLASVGKSYSVQSGVLQVHSDGAPANNLAVVLTAETGLIGSPEHAPPEKGRKPVLRCKALLNSALVPGGLVQLKSLNVRGNFVIQKVEHSGDSHGSDWTSSIEAVEL